MECTEMVRGSKCSCTVHFIHYSIPHIQYCCLSPRMPVTILFIRSHRIAACRFRLRKKRSTPNSFISLTTFRDNHFLLIQASAAIFQTKKNLPTAHLKHFLEVETVSPSVSSPFRPASREDHQTGITETSHYPASVNICA